eukprot:CAMPEP_0173461832 /NCGR_PEP_ID=MMETSP1357-20121228/65600_1 /TAXON_ID=77926 /ORGANISM="Hemiselmis rufescens, Strain PCC563" /LENGTH=93 /DNA_ID=CAMNT_0014429523 /DNA_START=24 /DNA_END=302 /DNA_ORIENTATION=+
MIASAYARVGLRDQDLWQAIILHILDSHISAFSAVTIATLLHSAASLNADDPTDSLIDVLFSAAVLLPVQEYNPQSVANLAWAASVVDVGDPP